MSSHRSLHPRAIEAALGKKHRARRFEHQHGRAARSVSLVPHKRCGHGARSSVDTPAAITLVSGGDVSRSSSITNNSGASEEGASLADADSPTIVQIASHTDQLWPGCIEKLIAEARARPLAKGAGEAICAVAAVQSSSPSVSNKLKPEIVGCVASELIQNVCAPLG